MNRFTTALAAATVLVSCLAGYSAQAQEKGASEAQIRKLIEVTNATEQGRRMIPAISKHIWSQLLRRAPNITDQAKQEITDKMIAAMTKMTPVFVELSIPIYQRHLTAEEADAAIAFYSTPLGKSFADKSITVAIESMEAGAQLGREMARKAAEIAIENLRKKGYQL